MSREILFRAYDKYRKEYLSNGNLFIAINKSNRPNKSEIYLDEISNADKYKDRFVVEQYTGLPDKNGKKIFEGDICNVCRGADIETGVVYYDERVGAWGIRYNKKECNLLFDIFTSKDINVWIEVIGNIHSNPELLEAEEK